MIAAIESGMEDQKVRGNYYWNQPRDKLQECPAKASTGAAMRLARGKRMNNHQEAKRT